LSRLGKLYDQVLKIKHRAKPCFERCLELALTLVPRVLTTERKFAKTSNNNCPYNFVKRSSIENL